MYGIPISRHISKTCPQLTFLLKNACIPENIWALEKSGICFSSEQTVALFLSTFSQKILISRNAFLRGSIWTMQNFLWTKTWRHFTSQFFYAGKELSSFPDCFREVKARNVGVCREIPTMHPNAVKATCGESRRESLFPFGWLQKLHL